MEVHPPHEPVHGWRDALIHIGLMTVGLFIALMLEAGVESLHHRELVRASRENIRRELEENHEHAAEDIAYLRQSGDRVQAGLKTLRFLQVHPHVKGQSISFTVNFVDLNDSAWRTARDTGALGYMPLEEVQSYASLYGLQETVQDQALHLLSHQAEALAPLMTNEDDYVPSDAEFAAMRQAGATSFADVYVLQQLVRNLDQEYVAALKRK